MTRNRTQPQIETLETRRLMAAITINGTPGNDTFHVDLLPAGTTLTINGMGGSDVVWVGSANHTMQSVQGDVVIKNPTGQTSVSADDSSDATSRFVNISATSITGMAPGAISFDSGTYLTINGGSNDDTFTVAGTGAGMWIGGGLGDDQYQINQHKNGQQLTVHDVSGKNEYFVAQSTGNLDDVTGPIAIGDSGGSVSVFDTQAPAGHTYWLTKTVAAGVTQTKLARSGAGAGMTMDDMGRINLFTSNHDDIVYSTGATAQLPNFELYTNDGNDTVYANNGAAESLSGGAGVDTVTVDYRDGAGGFETVKAAATDGSILGNVFLDKNGNGVQDAGEAGLASTWVYLDANNNKVQDGTEVGNFTDGNGNWSFIGVPTGKEFIARLDLSSPSLAQTTPAGGGGIHVTLSAGQTATGKKFGVKEVTGAIISGTVFNDTDGDGVKDAGEGILSGRTVYIDADNDKVLDAGEKSMTTDGNGAYSFTGLAAGTYKVRQVLPAGWSQTTPASGSGISVTVSTNQTASGKLFGARQAAPVGASIAGTIFNDLDGDGSKDAGEGGLSGRTVWLDLDNDKVIDAGEATTTTDANGNFKFTGLAAGTYKVRQVLPAGWSQTTPSNGFGINVTLTTNQTVSGKLFGEHLI